MVNLYGAPHNHDRMLGSERGTLIKRPQYGERWIGYFKGKSKKKVICRELTENGKTYPALGTFYGHVRQLDIARVLESYLETDQLSIVVRILRLKGSVLAARLAEVQRVDRGLRADERHIREQAVA